jgi:hypothetical protein
MGTTAHGLRPDIKALFDRLREGGEEEPVFEHIGLPRERSNLGPGLWFLAGAVAVTVKVLLMFPESGWLRRGMARLAMGEPATRPSAVDEPFWMEDSPPKAKRDRQRVARTRSDSHHISA